MTDEELGRKIWERANGETSVFSQALPSMESFGRAARALLAKPVATREVVASYLEQHTHLLSVTVKDVDLALALISHFAPLASNAPILRDADAPTDLFLREWTKLHKDFSPPVKFAFHCATEVARLARAKAIVQAWGWVEPWETVPNTAKQAALTAAHKVETTDAALGVVSVPVEATEEIITAIAAKLERPSGFDGRPSLRAAIRAQDIYHTALAASPLREKPDE